MKAEQYSEWRVKLEELHLAHDQLEGNLVYRKLIEQAITSAAWCDRQAGLASSDRDMNRLHGQADAYRALITLAGELVAGLSALYEEKHLEVLLEEATGARAEHEQEGHGDNGAGDEAGASHNPAPRKKRVRSRDAKVEDVPDKRPGS